MQVTAIVKNSATGHEVLVRTGNVDQASSVPPKSSGKGSAINGGEFLMVALATCYWRAGRVSAALGQACSRVMAKAGHRGGLRFTRVDPDLLSLHSFGSIRFSVPSWRTTWW